MEGFRYSSAVYTSLAASNYAVAVVTGDHFAPGAYSDITNLLPKLALYYKDEYTELLNHVLEGYNESPQIYEDLTLSECTKLYNADYISNHRNLFLITKDSSNTTRNNTLLDMILVRADSTLQSSWICAYHLAGEGKLFKGISAPCSPREVMSNVTSGLPWWVMLTTGEEVEVSGCKSERTVEKCNVLFSLEIMTVVICCNLIKACCMVLVVGRSREPTLVTLGDAIDSFLGTQDTTTMGICFADRFFIRMEWSREGWRPKPRNWKQMGVQRWWTSASRTRWITCNFFCSIIIIATGALLRLGMNHDGKYWSTDIKSM